MIMTNTINAITTKCDDDHYNYRIGLAYHLYKVLVNKKNQSRRLLMKWYVQLI